MLTWKELSTRSNDGTTVSLEWCKEAIDGPGEIRVRVVSESEDFTLYPAPCHALDAYYHPFAYANLALVGKVPA